MKNMKKYISMMVVSLMAVSCVDTVILPDDKTVDEDMWLSKSQVQQNVNEAYRSMTTENVVSRLIVWGGLRSEELIPAASITGTVSEDLMEINLANTQPDNTYATWADIYSVINKCNLVLNRASRALSEDPSYTEGDYLADCSQMLALRSLCYFYLVRNFRDVPYVTEAYMEATQVVDIPQSSPDYVLEQCINDLETAEKNAISPLAYADWRRVGYITRDGINALLADIYLWRGSVKHSASDYEQAIVYSDKVIESKKSQHLTGIGQRDDKDYPLADGNDMFDDLFISQNAEESIYELQYAGTTSSANMGVCKHYGAYKSGSNIEPYLYASNIFGFGATTNAVYRSSSTDDWRGKMNTYIKEITTGGFDVLEIRKFVCSSYSNIRDLTSKIETKPASVYSDSYKQNFIIYRLTDVMLMKAEALVGLAQLSTDTELDLAHMRPAFDLVNVVNKRAKPASSIAAADTLKWGSFSSSVSQMEELVLAERLRELAFEGKRWYDLMRYSYRHMDGVDYTTTLASQEENGAAFAATAKSMLDLVKRKLGSKGDAVAAKIGTEPRLYMPIPLRELKLSRLLKQTPGYSSDDNISKQ